MKLIDKDLRTGGDLMKERRSILALVKTGSVPCLEHIVTAPQERGRKLPANIHTHVLPVRYFHSHPGLVNRKSFYSEFSIRERRIDHEKNSCTYYTIISLPNSRTDFA